jgi:hypothetical protein
MYVILDKKKPGVGKYKRLKLGSGQANDLQLTNISFRIVTYIKAQHAAQACTERNSMYVLYKCYVV